MAWIVTEGDCVGAMATMPESSVAAVVCDPPYGLEFMGKEWDRLDSRAYLRTRIDGRTNPADGKSTETVPESYVGGLRAQRWHEEWAREALRVLKPGGHLLAFGGTRTSHRLACAIEDAGFEIRDTIAWMYGSGFPKSLDVGKALPDWEGWGTALKPAHEPVVVARKPLAGTVAGNVLAHGTGALNVDGCRIEGEPWTFSHTEKTSRTGGGIMGDPSAARDGQIAESHPAGRWPANVTLDQEAAGLLDRSVEPSVSRVGKPRGAASGEGWGMTATGAEYDDEGGPSRFFYVAKASSAERNAGLDGFEEREVPIGNQRPGGAGGLRDLRLGEEYVRPNQPRRNIHPTVKPISLMRWLVRLVTPPGGLVLDPFAGSGTTGCAAILEGFDFHGIEREPEYAEIARARIDWWTRHPEGMDIIRSLEADATRRKIRDTGQGDLLSLLDAEGD